MDATFQQQKIRLLNVTAKVGIWKVSGFYTSPSLCGLEPLPKEK
jgi:hypothetical protein